MSKALYGRPRASCAVNGGTCFGIASAYGRDGPTYAPSYVRSASDLFLPELSIAGGPRASQFSPS